MCGGTWLSANLCRVYYINVCNWVLGWVGCNSKCWGSVSLLANHVVHDDENKISSREDDGLQR